MLIKLYLMRYPIWACGVSLWYAFRSRTSCGIYAYILHPYILRWLISGLIIVRLRAFWRLSAGDFYARRLVGVRLTRYVAAFTISGHISSGRLAWIRMQQTLAIITPLERSAEPFYSSEYSINILRLISFYLI